MTTPALLIFKPDAAYRRAVRSAIWRWLGDRDDFKLTGLRWFHPPAELIEQHYDFLKERPFFGWLVDFMSALPVVVGRLEAVADPGEVVGGNPGDHPWRMVIDQSLSVARSTAQRSATGQLRSSALVRAAVFDTDPDSTSDIVPGPWCRTLR